MKTVCEYSLFASFHTQRWQLIVNVTISIEVFIYIIGTVALLILIKIPWFDINDISKIARFIVFILLKKLLRPTAWYFWIRNHFHTKQFEIHLILFFLHNLIITCLPPQFDHIVPPTSIIYLSSRCCGEIEKHVFIKVKDICVSRLYYQNENSISNIKNRILKIMNLIW